MDPHLPVAKRTRSQQDEAFRKLFEKRKSNVEHVSEESTSKKRQGFGGGSGGSCRFAAGREKGRSSSSEVGVRKKENCSVAGGSVEKGRSKQKDGVCFSAQRENVERGTKENPVCIDDVDDDDDHRYYEDDDDIVDGFAAAAAAADDDDFVFDDDDVEEEWKLSSGDDEGGSEEARRTEKRRRTGKGSAVEVSDHENDESEDDGFWILSEPDEGKDYDDKNSQGVCEKKKKNKRKIKKQKTNVGSSDESESQGFWIMSDPVEEKNEDEKIEEVCERKNEKEKTDIGTSIKKGEEVVFSSEGDEDDEPGQDQQSGESDYDGSEDDGFWIISQPDVERNDQDAKSRVRQRKNEEEKTNVGTSHVKEEDEEVFSSDGDEGDGTGKHQKSEESDFDGSENNGFWIIGENDLDKEKDTHDKNSINASCSVSTSNSDEEETFEVEEEDGDESEQDFSVSSDDNAGYVAQRNRSHGGKMRNQELGRGSKRSRFDEDEKRECAEMSESSDQDEEEEEEEFEQPIMEKQKSAEACRKEEQELSRKKATGKLKHGVHEYDVFQILADSICEKGEVIVDDLVSNEAKNGDQPVLPLLFKFGKKPEPPVEKSEFDLEVDKLWAEMDVALTYKEIGSKTADVVQNEGSLPFGKCSKDPEGTHHPKLEEELGLICAHCGDLLMEIRDYTSPFMKNPSRRHSEFRDLSTNDLTFFDELGYQDSDSESDSGTDICERAGTVWDLIPGVKNSFYPHQREGFEFMWKHIAGGIHRKNFENIENYTGGEGCIISHAPGTGKSRLTIVFLQAYMKVHSKCLPVIIAPSSMLLTWEEEFRKWKVNIPFHNLNIDELTGKEDEKALTLLRNSKVRAGRPDKNEIRIAKLYSWKKGGSILAISYTLFEKLANEQNNAKCKYLADILRKYPGLMVLDEGHKPRNNQSLIWQALSKVETPRRILLSGTPFQNNLNELYNTLCMVKPEYGSKGKARKEWSQHSKSFGKSADSEMERVKYIKSIIDPLVHIHKGDVLEESLPGLRESIVVLKPSEFQKSLLQKIEMEKKLQFVFENAISLTSVHPSLLLKSKAEAGHENRDKLEQLRLDPDAGVKTKFLIELIRLSQALNERVLVFSEYISSLSLMKEYLELKFGWTEKREVLYIDGKCDIKDRQCSINKLNDPLSEAKVVLASIKACGEGINLIGASRVVLLDVVWNPSLERQATRRAYRLGQKKVVYVYHLIASGTMEEDKYCRQAEKNRLSKLVFSSSHSTRNQQKTHPRVTEDKILDLMVQHEDLKPIFERISFKQKDNRPMVS